MAVFVVVAFVIVWRLVAQMAARDGRTYGDVLGDVLIAGFIQLYVPRSPRACASSCCARTSGEWWVLAFIIIAVVSDTGAYAAGLAFGRHPMAPRISPKKTWEGFAGAVVAALIAGVLLALFMLGLDWWMGIVFGLVILGTATVGDLGESMIKRDLGIKDMSSWLPGHGGVLDRLDSILLSGDRGAGPLLPLHPPGGIHMTTTEATPSAAFPEARGREKGYEKRAVDAFLGRARNAFEDGGEPADRRGGAAGRRSRSCATATRSPRWMPRSAASKTPSPRASAASVLAHARRPRLGRQDARDGAGDPRSPRSAQAGAASTG